MPKVGVRHFSYSKKGKQAAKAYAKRTGKKISNTKKRSSSYAKKKY
jgi:hypothetical protein